MQFIESIKTNKYQKSSCIYLRQTKICLETPRARCLGGTNGHHRRVARVFINFVIAFPLSMHFTLYSMQHRKTRTKNQSTNHADPLHVKRPSPVCACSHNGQSALTFCVSPVQASGPWKAMQNCSEYGSLIHNDSTVWLPPLKLPHLLHTKWIQTKWVNFFRFLLVITTFCFKSLRALLSQTEWKEKCFSQPLATVQLCVCFFK